LLRALRFGDQALAFLEPLAVRLSATAPFGLVRPEKRVGAGWVANEKMIAPLTKHPCHFAGSAS
jgi:hypothetical protein